MRHVALPAAVCTIAFVWTCDATAALAPYYERTREMGEILSSREVMDKLGSQSPIQGIEAIAPGVYRVWSAQCSLKVTLIGSTSAAPMPGPWQFSLKVREPQCK